MSNGDFRKYFLVAPGTRLKLADRDPNDTLDHDNKELALQETQYYIKRLVELQYLLYAEGKRSLLICLQGLDAAGKDGTIRHVLGAMNPQGCRVETFKVPTAEEASHDFLWRAHKVTPGKGQVTIFNRSHYEDVLVTRVHGLISKPLCTSRYDAINAFEQQLAANDTVILKFFLHISPEEQLKRFKGRLEDKSRWWKISEADYNERQHWAHYIEAYEDALSHCSTANAPWFVIPANRKWFRDLAIARLIVETLEALKMKTPEPKVNIEEIRKRFHQELNGKG